MQIENVIIRLIISKNRRISMPIEAKSNHTGRKTRNIFVSAGWILCVLLLFSFSRAERLPVKTYTTADGLQRDIVLRIRQDSRGFLWFCTGEGLSRFDGVGMTNFTVADGLPNRYVNDFLETGTGTIYVATSKGLARLNPRGSRGSAEKPLFTTFLPANARAEKIQTLYEDRNKRVWIGTSDGLYKLIEKGESAEFELVPLGEPLPGFGGAIAKPDSNALYINTILEDRHGTLWFGTFGSGLFRLSPDGSIRRYTASDGLGDNKITDLLEDRNGRLWVSKRSDDSGGVCMLDAEDAAQPIRKCYTVKDGLGSNWIRDMLESSDGQIWLATVPGLCRWQSGGNGEPVCKTYTVENNLCDDVLALAEDKDGNLWTGSPCGAKKIARYGFTTYNITDGLDKHRANSIFENQTGDLFVTAFPKTERVISRFDGERFTSIKPRLPDDVDYHGWGWQQTVWQDSRGAWWIPTGIGLFRSPDNTSFENLADAPLEKLEIGAGELEPFRLFEDSRGDVWIATTGNANGLKRWERAKNIWHDYTSQAGISVHRGGTAFVEDRNGNVWIGTSSDHNDTALIRYRGGDIRVFNQSEGAPAGWILDLFFDSRGRLWIASTEDGLLRLDDPDADRPEFIKYTPANGLTSVATTSVTEDEFGRIYIGTWRGVDRLTPETGQIENFSTADGLPGGYVESAYRDRKNNLWFLTDKGLARFQPEPVRTRKPPNILITGLRIEGEAQSVSILGETEIPPLDLRSDQRQITVEFLGLGTSPGEKLKYEYRFGAGGWTATDERTLNFANLAPGDYRFEVRAKTADRIYSRTAALVSFKIAAPLWQRWWFLALIALAFGIFVYLIYKYRLRRLLELEKMRTRIATDLHDDIGLNLTKISIMSEVARRLKGEKQGEMLNSIADISRSSVSSMSDIVWAINPKKDSLLELTRRMRGVAEEFLGQNNVLVEFNASEILGEIKLDADVRRNVFLIFKESLNNVVRHARAGKVIIDLTVVHNNLRLTVTDDGVGFDAAQNFDGNGLLNMKRRAADLKGIFEISSEPGSGTKIVLEISLERRLTSRRLRDAERPTKFRR
jgi:signal transduction histidine kinase/ligand-binding sensor domain-containing protein